MGKKPKPKQRARRKVIATSYYGPPFDVPELKCICGCSTWRHCKKFYQLDGRDKVMDSCACVKCGRETEYFPSPEDLEIVRQKKLEDARKYGTLQIGRQIIEEEQP